MIKGMTSPLMERKGFTLVEILVFMALAGIAMLVSSQLFLNQMHQQHQVQVSGNFDQIRSAVQSAAKNSDVLNFSATLPGNTPLANCINSTGANDTNMDCDTTVGLQDIKLVFRDGHEVGGDYRMDGKRCPAAAPDCPFRVTTRFQPICPQNPALTVGGKCARAQGIQVAWAIEQLSPVPNMKYFKKIEANVESSTSPLYAVPVPVITILSAQNVETPCPPIVLTSAMVPGLGSQYGVLVNTSFPQTVTSFDAYGMPVCGIDKGALDAELLKREVCKLYIQNVWNGVSGTHVQKTTPSCDIQVVKNFKLAGGGHWSDDCSTASGFDSYFRPDGTAISNVNLLHGGQVQHLNGASLSDAEVAQLVVDYELVPADSVGFCRFNSGTCPAGYNWYNSWSTTQKSLQEIKTRYRTWGLTSGCGYDWGGNGCSDACPGSTARDGTKCDSGEHGWSSNSTVEGNVCANKLRCTATGACDCGGGCACSDGDVNDGTYRVESHATRTQVGCN
ncbi:MAG: hypothetical protein EBX52_11370 [Proteobacteria bacterium]|nr:hypothetical protein [Pseudomonadota bacterium]